VDGKASLKGVWLSHVNHLNFGGHSHIPGMANRLRRCMFAAFIQTYTVKGDLTQRGVESRLNKHSVCVSVFQQGTERLSIGCEL